MLRYADDGSEQDITSIAADLLVSYLMSAGHGESTDETEHLCDISLRDGALAAVRLATVDLHSSLIGEVPAERLLPLLSAALTAAISAHEPDQESEPDRGAEAAPTTDSDHAPEHP